MKLVTHEVEGDSKYDEVVRVSYDSRDVGMIESDMAIVEVGVASNRGIETASLTFEALLELRATLDTVISEIRG